ncbi:ImmA/IrrE family metallo-endopeptidase [Formicincola oecophyllae]|uniref:ImmA/IrrE family metallo-endopeptidase n=1 Tax=Formicincola oecophyllae TaxID=2558361 RepID=A0A4Y6U9E9_9PROT|nr:ImmA/IrrE family metallo-endopeptidase [Formicincola oecophyllae]QDH14093.1 ImmA/IrrE family metallo-endopeptidase [Formicincola oecophyllae]
MSKILTAEQVLLAYSDRGVLPIDPVTIARRAGVEVEPENFKDGVCGWYIPASGTSRPVIQYHWSGHENRQRFTIAHELGHHFLQHGERPRDTSRQLQESGIFNADPVEVAANYFAADLIMPSFYVKTLYRMGMRSVDELAKKFRVSVQAMDIRVNKLGLSLENPGILSQEEKRVMARFFVREHEQTIHDLAQ